MRILFWSMSIPGPRAAAKRVCRSGEEKIAHGNIPNESESYLMWGLQMFVPLIWIHTIQNCSASVFSNNTNIHYTGVHNVQFPSISIRSTSFRSSKFHFVCVSFAPTTVYTQCLYVHTHILQFVVIVHWKCSLVICLVPIYIGLHQQWASIHKEPVRRTKTKGKYRPNRGKKRNNTEFRPNFNSNLFNWSN